MVIQLSKKNLYNQLWDPGFKKIMQIAMGGFADFSEDKLTTPPQAGIKR
jgi:hypothetical protein